MSLPINFLGREFAEAQLRDRRAARQDKDTIIPLHFNPAEYKLTKENTFAEIPIPGWSRRRCSTSGAAAGC